MTRHRHVVMGFQSSGKTTFAAALWHLVDSREVPTALTKGSHNGDYRYLEEIASAWEEGWQVIHTPFGTWQPITINLRSDGLDDEVGLSFIDMSGETFEQIFVRREFDTQIEEMIRGCEGLMLFVTTLRAVDDVSIVDIGIAMPDEMPKEMPDLAEEGHKGDGAGAHLANVEPDADGNAHDTASSQVSSSPTDLLEPVEFKPEHTPRQVQITDLLDSFSEHDIGLSPARVAVIVSAWDKAPEGITPQRWLAERMPLLDQYLKSHAHRFDTRIYGVSAQGGHLPKKEEPGQPSDRVALLAEPVASRRIRVVGHGAGPHDLTHPIAWLSGLDR
ncbi:hypothetical protein GTW51_18000 [Aurantimonas aggregata]|uniref:Double-GTPase 1 domain-containing protein n=1 Tax=Aurantimonas aggregata TaxID=2047720 RepID=A0A6L9MM68_9HYPH|nr:hypothetical protein [Aurantimonas aggregata]NDV88598.1 hypothetical protein [Aurantimonas aggregata]